MVLTIEASRIPPHLTKFFRTHLCSSCYTCHLVGIFMEAHRVLRDDGTMWVDIGDTYSWKGVPKGYCGSSVEIKPKDLCGVPWRLALALQAEGWWLRNAVIWEKVNRVPDPATDRIAVGYEHVFLFTKARKYFFDLDAIRIPHTSGTYQTDGSFTPSQQWLSETGDRTDRKIDKAKNELGSLAGSPRRTGRGLYNPNGKNPGDIWPFGFQPYPGAHDAPFPPELPERCILAGTSEQGVCSTCGAPWARVVERMGGPRGDHTHFEDVDDVTEARQATGENRSASGSTLSKRYRGKEQYAKRTTTGWGPTCSCPTESVRATVLDPFSGSGTTGMVALRLGRDYIGIDLNADYLPLASSRILDLEPPKEVVPEEGDVLDIFG